MSEEKSGTECRQLSSVLEQEKPGETDAISN